MRRSTFLLSGVLSFLPCLAYAAEHRLTREQLPAAVASAVTEHTQGATIKGFSTEREHGKQVYEAETVVDGHTRDLQFASDGTLEEVEEEVPLASLPPEVQRALTAKAKGAQITKVESLVKGDKLVAYEAATLSGRKKGEVQVGPKGESLAHSE